MQEVRYLLVSDEAGIYLGSYLGLGFWSKLDPVGQDAACTFDSPSDVAQFMATWDNQPNGNVRTVEVTPDIKGGYASIAACVAAGLDAWDPDR